MYFYEKHSVFLHFTTWTGKSADFATTDSTVHVLENLGRH
jgi:hypothetical protein